MYYFLVTLIAITIFGESIASHNHIKDHTIYKIFCKVDNGVLTISTDSSGTDDLHVKLQSWSDAGGQKWKSKQPKLAKSFEFKPTSNDKTRLDSDAFSGVFARVASKGQDTKYWYVKDMGESVFQIKNYVTGTCIASQGMNKAVKLMSCDNSPQQQWAFNEL